MADGKYGKEYYFANGWIKQSKNGGEYISGAVSNKLKLFARLEDGTEIPINYFAAFFTDEDKKKTEKSPDLSFKFSEGTGK